MTKGRNDYPADWDQISLACREAAGWRCVRCMHPHDRPGALQPCDDLCRHPLLPIKQRVLTVHHLDGDKSNCEWWNLAALCQACHLTIQGRVIMARVWIFPHSDWFRPYVAGYYAFHAGLPHDREYVAAHIDSLIALGQEIGV